MAGWSATATCVGINAQSASHKGRKPPETSPKKGTQRQIGVSILILYSVLRSPNGHLLIWLANRWRASGHILVYRGRGHQMSRISGAQSGHLYHLDMSRYMRQLAVIDTAINNRLAVEIQARGFYIAFFSPACLQLHSHNSHHGTPQINLT